jgi:hypothetical protein
VPFRGRALEIGSYDGKFLGGSRRWAWKSRAAIERGRGAAARDMFGIETTLEYFTPDTFAADSFDLVSARLVLDIRRLPTVFCGDCRKS